MAEATLNKYRAAIDVLQRGREVLVDALAEEIVDHQDQLSEGGYYFNELLETQGTRLHFLCLLIGQLEQSAEAIDEAHAPPTPAAPKARRRRPKSKKVHEQSPTKGSADDV